MKNLIDIDTDIESAVCQAEKIFFDSGVFIYPTDTVYGFGGNPFEKVPAKKISLLKKRSDSKKYIYLVSSVVLLKNYVHIEKEQEQILEKIWPASVSVILNLQLKWADLLGQKTAAFRIPPNEFCMRLLQKIKSPLISTSVNLEGQKPMTAVNEILKYFAAKVDAVFYTSNEQPALASTLIDLTGNTPVLIRQGTINFLDLLHKIN